MPKPTDRTPEMQLQTSFWNSWNAAHREERPPGPQILRRAHYIVDAVRRLELDAPRILEAGCGTGWMCNLLSACGSVTGYDLAEAVIARARHQYPNIAFVSGDILELDLGGPYDVVVNMEVLSHVYDQRAFVKRLHDCLRPGGHLFMTTQNRFVYELRTDVAAQEPGQIRRWLFRADVQALLQPDFEIQSMTTLGPAGDLGMARLVNSAKLAACARTLGLENAWRRIRELGGFGESIFVHARKREQ